MYLKSDQTKRNRADKKVCLDCKKRRELRFYSSRRMKICNTCKLNRYRKSQDRVCDICKRRRKNTYFLKPSTKSCNDCRVKKMKDEAKNTITYLKNKAWKAFSKYIRLRDAIKTTGTKEYCVCISCNKKTEFALIQAGHLISGREGSVLFDEEIVNGQCYRCNMHLKGNYEPYLEKMIQRHGLERVEEMLAQKKEVRKYTREDYKEIEEKYKQLVKEI